MLSTHKRHAQNATFACLYVSNATDLMNNYFTHWSVHTLSSIVFAGDLYPSL